MVNPFTKLKSPSKQAPHPRHENAEHTVRAPTLRSLKKQLRADPKKEEQLGRQTSDISRNVELLRSDLREAEPVILDGV